ncbi:hypothetical protein [Oleiagrimonas sp. MCCC 1A03011]|uniref:hypothetical protein n=1 Tax=Oleiagrimonas sp. MCCC 1A03011 TaxID=1926883 RepID=UPI000DC245DE|nr:hypothetical protein [Oleiagrimonas sp. MCCC 1A03011]RAP58470.1 hypothetical protein BTJ49_05905 [Oleiagrimonas sp. MCCC 1A03011]
MTGTSISDQIKSKGIREHLQRGDLDESLPQKTGCDIATCPHYAALEKAQTCPQPNCENYKRDKRL